MPSSSSKGFPILPLCYLTPLGQDSPPHPSPAQLVCGCGAERLLLHNRKKPEGKGSGSWAPRDPIQLLEKESPGLVPTLLWWNHKWSWTSYKTNLLTFANVSRAGSGSHSQEELLRPLQSYIVALGKYLIFSSLSLLLKRTLGIFSRETKRLSKSWPRS